MRQREQEVVRLATEGRSQHEIARLVGITQPAVSQLLKRVDERWMQQNADRLGRYKAEQTRRLEHVVREAMQAWEASKTQHTRRRQRQVNGVDGDSGGTMAEVIVDDSHGDPRFLDLARRALADLARLWGSPTSTATTETTDAPAVITLRIGDERTAPRLIRRQGEDKERKGRDQRRHLRHGGARGRAAAVAGERVSGALFRGAV